MFHCGKTLFENQSGPFFYLSKVTCTHTHMHIHYLTHTHNHPNTQICFCFSGGECCGGQTMEQDICLDTREGIFRSHCLLTQLPRWWSVHHLPIDYMFQSQKTECNYPSVCSCICILTLTLLLNMCLSLCSWACLLAASRQRY